MPIEFACSSCSKLLRVADSSGGKSCKCPACGSHERIPVLEIVEIVEAVDDPQEASKLKIPCPNCTHRLTCDPSLVGTKGQCRSCKCIFIISEDPKLATPIDPSDALVFTCPKCNQLFEGKSEMQGKKGKCHVCNEVFVIELKEAEEPVIEIPMPSHSKPAPTTPILATASKLPIRFMCDQCRGTMEVPGSAAGQKTTCPYCQHLTTIPRASQPIPAKPVVRPAMAKTVPISVAPIPVAPIPLREAPMASPGDIWSTMNAPVSQMGTLPAPSYDVTNPYSAGAAGPSYTPRSRPQRREPWVYILPGTIMAVMAGLCLVVAVVSLISLILVLRVFAEQIDFLVVLPRVIARVLGILLSSVLGFYVMMGAVAMIRRCGLSQAKTAAIIMLVPCSCMFFAFPVGIWSCVLLFSESAKRDFDA